MNPQFVTHIIGAALMAAFWICAPLLLITFALSIVVNLIQIATSMQDSVFSTVPRLAVCLVSFIFLMPWMLHRAAAYAASILGDLAHYAR
jgi:flagellar biosynthesis protein FliQ